MNVYHLKVSLFGYHEQPITKLHRLIEISENSTFEDLHDTIFEAFDRIDPHLYTFFITKKDSKDMRAIMHARNITNPYSFTENEIFGADPANAATTKIKDAKLAEKDVFHYWFDFGDDWWHRIRVEKITTDTKQKKAFVKISKKVGQSPAQYDYNDEGDFDEFAMEEIDLERMGIDQAQLDVMGVSEDDLTYLMETMSQNSSEAMVKIVEKFGVDKVVSMLEIVGTPNIQQLTMMLKNLPVLVFLESMEQPDITLQQERDLLTKLIDNLQTRLANIEQSIAQTTPNKKEK